MEGEIEESDNERAMSGKKPWQKLIIIVAGAFMNFVLAWVLLFGINTYIGTPTNVIKAVQPDSPAARAELQPGDKIVAVDHKELGSSDSIRKYLKDEPGEYTLTIRRNGNLMERVVKTEYIGEEQTARFGFVQKTAHYHVLTNLKDAFTDMIGLIREVWLSLIGLVTGAIGFDQMSGVVGIVNAGGQVWKQSVTDYGIGSAIINMIFMAALLSANLGIVNLLPLPALDGGRALFILIEMIRGKAVPPEKEGAVHFVGMVLLMLLTAAVTFNDVMRLLK